MSTAKTEKLIQNQELVTLGTGKQLTFDVLRILYGLNLNLQDPESADQEKNIPAETEPEGDSFKAVLFKLLRLQLLIDNLKLGLVADITYEVNGKSYSRWIRNKQDQENFDDHKRREALQVALLEYGDVAFEPIWTVVFGGANDSIFRLGSLRFKAKVNPISLPEIETRLNPYSNAGIDMLEHLRDNQIPIYLVDDDGQEYLVDIDLVIQLVVYKAPTLPIIEKILFADAQVGQELFAPVILGLADLQDPNI